MLRLLVICSLATFALGAPQLKAPELDGRIVGGQPARIEDHRYQVSVQYFGSHHCGGVIISSTWVLTAAHCLERAFVIFFSVRAGSTNRASGGQVVSVSNVITHSSFQGVHNDISLLQLASPLNHVNANAIPLASESGPTVGAIATISGWGDLVEGGPSSPTLQVVQIPVISQAECREAYGERVTETMWCAGFLGVGGKDACQGDSGGPAVVGGVLHGLVSWGFGCARYNFPGVYVNISYFRSWIRTNSGV